MKTDTVWKTMDGIFLIQGNMSGISYFKTYTFGLENGEQFNESAEYFEVTDEGIVLKKYLLSNSFGLEYDLITYDIHRVIENSLYRFRQNEHCSAGITIEKTNEKLLSGLQPYDGDLPFDLEVAIDSFEKSKT